jgi:hypothetical protein
LGGQLDDFDAQCGDAVDHAPAVRPHRLAAGLHEQPRPLGGGSLRRDENREDECPEQDLRPHPPTLQGSTFPGKEERR